ncbi:chemotaxis protein CheW [Altererythrobacter sp. GH1-8]|uniref:chemotaxis protein CheW n=1 Tax=Altererythrobacter sp. GH1-8 TaxID=3349333 RepID=UPI00374D7305
MELLVMITIDGRQCALRTVAVKSVMEIEAITSVPMAPRHVLGLSTRRSQTLTVIDCMSAAGLPAQTAPIGKRAAVVSHEGHTYALLVDKIEDVENTLGEVQPVSAAIGENWSRLAEGMVETNQGPALILSIASLVVGPEQMPRAA